MGESWCDEDAEEGQMVRTMSEVRKKTTVIKMIRRAKKTIMTIGNGE